VSEAGVEVDGVDVGFWNIFLMSIFGFATGAASGAGAVAGEEDAVDGEDAIGIGPDEVAEATCAGNADGLDEMEAFPLTCVCAGTVPKDLTISDLSVGAAAGEEEIGADASSIDPKVTA